MEENVYQDIMNTSPLPEILASTGDSVSEEKSKRGLWLYIDDMYAHNIRRTVDNHIHAFDNRTEQIKICKEVRKPRKLISEFNILENTYDNYIAPAYWNGARQIIARLLWNSIANVRPDSILSAIRAEEAAENLLKIQKLLTRRKRTSLLFLWY